MQGPDLSAPLRTFVSEQSPLWPLTTMRVGGPARWLAQPKTLDDVTAVLTWIDDHQLPYVLLGGGANILFSDDGFAGVVIWVSKLKGMRIDGTMAIAACGENLSGFAHHLCQVGLAGMEWACGIPGTLGGAVIMNAGTSRGDVASVLSSVRVLTAEGVCSLPASELALGYRTSSLRTGTLQGILLEATFKLQPDDPQQCLERERKMLSVRAQTQPNGASSGCIFKNPTTGAPAGALLDQAGCKGMRVGSAVVSEQHANFILNESKNNADDVFTLIEHMRQRVLDHHGIALDMEVIVAR